MFSLGWPLLNSLEELYLQSWHPQFRKDLRVQAKAIKNDLARENKSCNAMSIQL